jgi:hypothetical protein
MKMGRFSVPQNFDSIPQNVDTAIANLKLFLYDDCNERSLYLLDMAASNIKDTVELIEGNSMIIDFPIDKCERPDVNSQKLVDYRDLIDTLVQSILAGENPIIDETYGDWRIRIESIAEELNANMYD